MVYGIHLFQKYSLLEYRILYGYEDLWVCVSLRNERQYILSSKSETIFLQEPIILQTKSKPMPKKNANDDYDDLTAEEIALLGKSFKSADFDGDKLLSESEIEMAIVRLTKKHVQVLYCIVLYCNVPM